MRWPSQATIYCTTGCHQTVQPINWHTAPTSKKFIYIDLQDLTTNSPIQRTKGGHSIITYTINYILSYIFWFYAMCRYNNAHSLPEILWF